MDAMGNYGDYVIPVYKDRGGPSCSTFHPRFIAAGLWVARWQHHFQPPFFWSKEGTMGEGENQLQHHVYPCGVSQVYISWELTIHCASPFKKKNNIS